ncbi:MAG: tautomerase family protein [Massilia sp.]|jgi:phenylpyruvate tautomerase PptA (4-oxalocrotonate tautomerase family)
MPFVRLSLRRGKSREYLRAVADAVHQALVDAFHIPPADRFQAIHQHEPEELIFDRDYLGGPRSDDFLLVCVTGGKPRDAGTKQVFYRRLAELLAASPGLRPEDLMVIVQTTDYADWSFSGGIAAPLAEQGART